MRFRAKLVEISCIQHFTSVLSTISKLAKLCVLRITQNKLYFIMSERVVNGGVSIWCELVQGHFFNEYAMDGVSAEHNEIYLELTTEQLVKSLKTAQMAKSVKVKLTKKHTPCLTLEVELPSISSHSRMVTHDIPVNVIPRRLWDDFQEPELPTFDVSIYIPAFKTLRNVVERMKNLSNYITVSANQRGEMKLKVESDLVTIETHFRDLEHPVWDQQGSSQSEHHNKDWVPEEFAGARIDIKKFHQFLSSHQVNPTRVICNLVDQRVAHFFLLHEDLSLQYFLPVVSL